jgi:hypothetical protein
VELQVLATFGDLADRAATLGLLEPQDLASLAEWRADTAAWSQAHGGPAPNGGRP